MAKISKKVLYDFMQKLAVKSNKPTMVSFEEMNKSFYLGLFEHVDDIVFDEYYTKWLLSSAEERVILENEMNERIILLMGVYNAF